MIVALVLQPRADFDGAGLNHHDAFLNHRGKVRPPATDYGPDSVLAPMAVSPLAQGRGFEISLGRGTPLDDVS
jgi:hypothetical protein